MGGFFQLIAAATRAVTQFFWGVVGFSVDTRGFGVEACWGYELLGLGF